MSDLLFAGTGSFATLGPSIRASAEEGVARVDLRQMTFGYPEALVGICTFVQRSRAKGKHVTFQKPHSSDVANYLARVRLPSILEHAGVEHDLPQVRERNTRGSLFELRPFTGLTQVEELAEHIQRALGNNGPSVYAELVASGENVIDHSGVASGFLMAQLTHSRKALNFAVGDSGVGLRRTLARRGATDDASALKLSLKDGVSGKDERGRGTGLKQLADNAVSTGGTLTLISGKNRRTVRRSGAESFSHIRSFKGTLVCGSIPAAA